MVRSIFVALILALFLTGDVYGQLFQGRFAGRFRCCRPTVCVPLAMPSASGSCCGAPLSSQRAAKAFRNTQYTDCLDHCLNVHENDPDKLSKCAGFCYCVYVHHDLTYPPCIQFHPLYGGPIPTPTGYDEARTACLQQYPGPGQVYKMAACVCKWYCQNVHGQTNCEQVCD